MIETALSELCFMSRIMSALSQKYFEFKSIWESVCIKERIINKPTERFCFVEMKLLPKQSTSSNALVASKIKKTVRKYDRKYYICAKPGHFAQDCF